MEKQIKNYVYLRDNGKCFHCGKDIKFNQVNIDHYFPRSKGGKAEYYNLVLSCKKCNKYKSTTVPKDYKKVNIELFKKAFKDNKIPISWHCDKKDIFTDIEMIYDFEIYSEYTLFKANNALIFTKKNKVIKISKIGGII